MGRRFAIGVVGAGPKGTYALDRLATGLVRQRPDVAIEVHVFEPHRDLGAGPVYDVAQPHYLRLNYANREVDMWNDGAGPSLVQWLESHHPHLASPHDSAPRAIVGEYLRNGFERVMSRLGEHAAILFHRTAATRVQREHGTWVITTVDDEPVTVDSVLITTGHGSRSSRVTGLEGSDFIDSVYPVADSGLDQIAAGSRVAVRGLGLTAIDAALALTEGRGGRFDPSDSPIPTYRPSGHEPSVIAAYSRTGITMTPKPSYVRATYAAYDSERARRRCSDVLRDATDPVTALSAFLADASARLVPDENRTSISDPRHAVSHAVHVAYGTAPRTHDDALAAAWRSVYPSIVDAVLAHRFDRHWDQFATLTRQMERIAFGPPAANAARFAALVEAGVVDLGVASDPRVTRTTTGFTLETATATRCVDVLVNAVIAAPGVGREPAPLFAGLLDDGHVRRTAHGEGIAVDRNSRAIGANGRRSPGLAVIGRMTDGATLGNDTLSRTLHDFPDRWATACLADVARTGEDRRVTA